MSEQEQSVVALARKWHAMSDHAADGTPFGGGLCNCEKQAERVAVLIRDLAKELQSKAVAEADANGGRMNARGAAIWDVAGWLREDVAGMAAEKRFEGPRSDEQGRWRVPGRLEGRQ